MARIICIFVYIYIFFLSTFLMCVYMFFFCMCIDECLAEIKWYPYVALYIVFLERNVLCNSNCI